MAGRRVTNPAGSSNSLRGDVLRVLGVLKVATADQIQRIGAPHLNHRHTDKKTASEQKTARTAAHNGALSDMRKHHQSENGGSTETGDRLRHLTLNGLRAASHELRRPASEMGSTARGAGSSGASHPMAVNETVIAMLRPKPDMAKLADDPADVRAAAQAVVDAPGGIGTIASYFTEVPLPATGNWNTAGKGGAQADLVLTAPQDKMPLLFIEVDNCHMTAEVLADKLEKYARFFRKKTKDTDNQERPMWRTRWTAPESWSGDRSYPPVLLVFNREGQRNPKHTIPRLAELTRHLWEGERQRGGHHEYDGRIPIIAVGLSNLREHGPHGRVFCRFGRDQPQSLWEAVGNPRREAAEARAQDETRRAQENYQAQLRRVAAEQAVRKAAEREARRPVCAGCGARFTDERWEAAGATDWDGPADTHPTLCDGCKRWAAVDEDPTAGTPEHHEPESLEVDPHEFRRYPRRPVCTECGGQFTDERWEAVNRVGWGAVPQETRPSLCEGCDQRYTADVRDGWSDRPPRQQRQEQEEQQEQALPEEKAEGWFSRFRRGQAS
ncbi:replication-relaxation family protein [Streptomyces xanthophaeus]|uniref:replication-relaxation family protein n=1 Tax=Streptomyces xanthophaeus TaxID=67385 RepID=UPI00342C4AFE